MNLAPEVQAYLDEVLRLLYLHPLQKRRVAKEIEARIVVAADGGLESVRRQLGSPRQLAAETMLALAESGPRPWGWGMSGRYYAGFEYKSVATWCGWPLLHITSGYDPETGRPRVAKGVVAIGSVAVGGLAVGGLSFGVLSLGGLSFGLGLALGGLSFGGLGAVGGIAVAAGIAAGAIAVAGKIALGALAVGPAAAGATAIGRDVVQEEAGRAEFLAWLGRNLPILVRYFR